MSTKTTTIIVLSSMAAFFLVFTVFRFYATNKEEETVDITLQIFCALAFIGFLVIELSYYPKKEIDEIYKERISIKQKIEKDQFDIFQIIQLSLNQLNEYYTLNKAQARISFRFSTIAIIFGLITIIAGIWLKYLGKIDLDYTIITGLAGVISEFVGTSYFFLYKKSLEQVNFFFAQLIKVQDTMLAVNISRDMDAPEKKNEMKEKIILSLLERSLK